MAKKIVNISKIKGATVFIDRNGDGKASEGELTATSDDLGNVVFEGKGKDLKGPLVATGGTNWVTNEANTETFKAPGAAKAINALSTLAVTMVQEQGVALNTAISGIKKSFGMTYNFLAKQPASVAENGKPGAPNVTKALLALSVQKQVDAYVTLAAAVLQGVGATVANAQASLLSALAAKVADGALLNLTRPSLIVELLTAAANIARLDVTTKAKVSAMSADAADIIADATGNIAEAVATVTSMGKLATPPALNAALIDVESVELLTVTVADAIQTAAADGSLAAVKLQYVGVDLDNVTMPFAVTIALGERTPAFVEKLGPDDGSNAQVINNAITLAGSGSVGFATVTITNTKTGDDLLFTSTSKIQGLVTTNGGNKILTLVAINGQSPTNADFEAALETVRFTNTSDTPDVTPRTIDFVIGNGNTTATAVTETVTVTVTNDLPVLALQVPSASFIEIDGPDNTSNDVPFGSSNVEISDVDGDAIARLTVSVANAAIKDGASEQLLVGGTTIALNASAAATNLLTAIAGITYSVLVTRGATDTTVVFSKSGGGNVTKAQAEALLDALKYNNASDALTAGDRVFSVSVNDGAANSAVVTKTISVAATIDSLAGTPGNDVITGGVGSDSITGNAGDDIITGAGGVDVLDGGDGNDTFLFANMAEFIAGNQVVDLIVGGNGIDKIQVNAALAIAAADNLGRVSTVEQLVAEPQSSSARAHSMVQISDAFLGSIRTIDLSTDTNAGSSGIVNLSGVTHAMTLKGVANGSNTLTGGSGVDTITGGSGTDIISGGAGVDVLDGGDGNDIFLVAAGEHGPGETITGGNGTDVIRFTSSTGQTLLLTASVNVEEARIASNTGTATGTTSESINALSATGNIALYGNDGANSLTGNEGANAINGNGGDDILVGNGGNDTLEGGAGNDTLEGGAGNDSLIGGDGNDLIDAGAGVDVVDGGAGNDVFVIAAEADLAVGESVTGGSGTDTLYLSNTQTYDLTRLLAAKDDLVTEAGIEQLIVKHSAVTLDEAISGTALKINTDGAVDLALSIAMTGTTLNLSTVTFGAMGDVSTATETALTAASDSFVVTGSAASDTITLSSLGDTVDAGAGDDVVLGGVGEDVITGGTGNDMITGGTGVDTLVGGAGNDVFHYAASADLLASATSIESIDGGTDSDEIRITTASTFTVANSVSWANVKFVEKITAGASAGAMSLSFNDDVTGAGITTIDLSGDTNAAGVNVIDLSADTTGSIITTITGSAGADVITGNSVAQTLNGGAGDDVFHYAAQAHLVSGGAFVDAIIGGTGTDELKITAASDFTVANSVSWAGVNTIEKITTGASAGAMSLSFHDDVTGAGITTIDLSGDTNAAGANKIDLSADTTGSIITTITGSAGADTIIGNSAQQTITGGAGADTLTGNGGNDVFAFTLASDSAPSAFDTITDFVAKTATVNGDVLSFANTAFGGTGAGIATFGGVFIANDGSLARAALSSNTDHTVGKVFFALDSSTGTLYVDGAGTGTGATTASDGTADMAIVITGLTTIDTNAIVFA